MQNMRRYAEHETLCRTRDVMQNTRLYAEHETLCRTLDVMQNKELCFTEHIKIEF